MTASAKAAGPTAAPKELSFTRVFAAPPALVFQAWSEARHLARWFAPRGFSVPVCEVDLRPGGTLHLVMRGPDGSDYPMRGVYHEVGPPARLVFTSTVLDGQGRSVLEVHNTVTFAPQGAGTRLTLHARVVAATEAAAFYLAGMEQGWRETLDRLGEVLAGATQAAH
jgi:uncharacterized protein YndB with AHSA1/START domain